MSSQDQIKRIAVLMTCYNRRDTTVKCLQALHDQQLSDTVSLKTYLADDGCTDGTGDAVRAQFPDVHIIEGDGNLYWCGGMRLAWASAMVDDYDAYLWLNDDTTLLPKAILTLLETAKDVYEKEGHAGIIVGSCRDHKTGKHTYGGLIRRSPRSRIFNELATPGDKMLPCDTMNGNVVLVPRETFILLGPLSPKYIHAWADTDYGLLARRNNIPVWMAPGYLAECTFDRQELWKDPNVRLRDRWAYMVSPTGLPPRQWYIYVRRHTGIMWPIYFVKPFIQVLFPRLRCAR